MTAAVCFVVVAAMIAVDLGLHVWEVWTNRPWPVFKNRNQYAGFWIAYWAVALVIAAFGIGSML